MDIKEIHLNCVLMPNNEIRFNGRSLGFITDEEKEKFVNPVKATKKKS